MAQQTQKKPFDDTQGRPNILVIFGDDIGYWNLSAYHQGMMGYRTPNIDRLAQEGAKFTSYYGQQSCTAGRAAFITGQSPYRTGLTKVGFPGADQGLRKEDPNIAELLKPLGYQTAQFGKNHFGDRDEFLPTLHGYDEFFGNLYHLNAEEEPENPDYPKNPEFRKKFGPRGVLKCKEGRDVSADVGQFLARHKPSLRFSLLEIQLNDSAGTMRIDCGDNFCLVGANRWPTRRGQHQNRQPVSGQGSVGNAGFCR